MGLTLIEKSVAMLVTAGFYVISQNILNCLIWKIIVLTLAMTSIFIEVARIIVRILIFIIDIISFPITEIKIDM